MFCAARGTHDDRTGQRHVFSARTCRPYDRAIGYDTAPTWEDAATRIPETGINRPTTVLLAGTPSLRRRYPVR
jgi:hypothetical protein